MKRLISLLVALMLMCTSAFAMENAAVTPDWDALERYASFAEEGTVWTVRSNQGAAALNRMGSETVPYNGAACFGLELTGDMQTGVVVPVLAFYYVGGESLKADVVSIAVNGKRYDIALYGETIAYGKNQIERMTAPLDEGGLAMIHELMAAEEMNISLQGRKVFNMEPEQKEKYQSAREELSARSLDALEAMLTEFEAMGEYDLWDLNEDWWERTRGMEPMIQVTGLPANEDEVADLAVALEEPMYILSRGAQGEAVRDLQRLLIDAGYMQGTVDGGFGSGLADAVAAAQKFLGLMPTGSADETLVRMLSGLPMRRDIGEEVISANAVELHQMDGVGEMTIGRMWFADAVESTGGDRRVVSDADNTLAIYEGTIKNLSAEELDFYWQMTAALKWGEYEYECTLVCETNDGMTLASSLLPMGEARLLVYAEIPECVADEGEWTLELTAGETTIEIK